ncbi:hypothetical protein Patl1_29019 [Pistacia atlantica]|uniref:Uncharacterized protein n=1 Tax=Pistacia atlantica TaxID=434234 RepID=A0ACC1BDB9_9ROSI|nr:hypothetical protein Patl1_29019 [Pistacia atlantica]
MLGLSRMGLRLSAVSCINGPNTGKHQYSSVPHTDEDGNPIYRTETTDSVGSITPWRPTCRVTEGVNTTKGIVGFNFQEAQALTPALLRKLVSGGIRKKGMKDKIKMKPPGGIITTPGGHNVMRKGRRQHHDKDGTVEMIKEKFPEQSQ